MTYIHCDYQVLKDAEAHLQLATQERSYYRSVVDASKEVLRETFTVDGELQIPPVFACLPPMTNIITMHFSIDMAQQVRWTLSLMVACTLLLMYTHSTDASSQFLSASMANVFPHPT